MLTYLILRAILIQTIWFKELKSGEWQDIVAIKVHATWSYFRLQLVVETVAEVAPRHLQPRELWLLYKKAPFGGPSHRRDLVQDIVAHPSLRRQGGHLIED